MSYIVVVTTTDSQDEAQKLAGQAIERRLAACVQIVGPLQSVYRWKGKVEQAEEFRCEMKTTSSHYVELAAMIRELHSYDVPEIIALPVKDISSEYANWLDGQTGEI